MINIIVILGIIWFSNAIIVEMKLIKKIILLICLLLLFTPSASAATFKSGENVFFSKTPLLENTYLAGDRVEVSVSSQKDIVAAGGTLLFEGEIQRSLMAAGGTITISGPISQSARIAGGTITIEDSIGEDLIVAGGTIRLSKTSSVGGDLIITGGTLEVEGPVKGNVYANGGDVRINAPVGGDVSGNMGQLTIGSSASIAGDLTYTSEEKVISQEGAVVKGNTRYTEQEHRSNEQAKALISAGTIYTLVMDILFSLLFVLVLGFITKEVLEKIELSKIKSLGLGFSSLFLMPVAGLFLLIIIWLGITWFVVYILLLLLSLGLLKIYVGAKILSWWEKRNKKEYVLDWKAAVLGPVVVLLLSFIPILGWFSIFILYLMVLGGLVQTVFDFISSNTSRSTK